MDPIVVVSPHADDAALSAGQFLAGWPGASVLTLFGGRPSAPQVTTFDVNSGFRDSTAAQVARAHEDDRAMQVLGARQLRAAFLDHQYRLLEAADPGSDITRLTDRVADVIGRTVAATGAARLIGPLGLAHPDHVIASNAVLEVMLTAKVATWLYEDVPTRVIDPTATVMRLRELGAWRPSLEFLGTGDMAVKERAVGCYQSQLWALDRNVIFVPERFHRMVPA